jgi:hypothetical protein
MPGGLVHAADDQEVDHARSSSPLDHGLAVGIELRHVDVTVGVHYPSVGHFCLSGRKSLIIRI